MLKKIILLSAFTISCIGLRAQDASQMQSQGQVTDTDATEVLKLSLREAKDYATQHNLNFKKTQNAVKDALYSKREAIASYIPQADASINYNNYLGAEISMSIAPGMVNKIPFNPTSTFTLQASQLIFNGNAMVGIMLGKIGQQVAEITEENQALALRDQVTLSYYTVLLSEKTRAILIQNLADIKDVANKTQAMADAGALEQTDADQLLVQVNLIENMIKNSDRNTELSYNLLKLQLGVNIDATVVLTEGMEELLNGANDSEILARPYYMEEDPSYRLVLEAQKMSEKQHLMSIMNALPTVSAFYSFNGKILKPEFDMSPKNVVGLQASVPIFKGLKNTNTFQRSKLGKENAAMDLALVSDQLRTTEKQYRYNLKTALEQYATQKLNVDVALRVFKSIELKYEQGVKSSLDLTTANSNYLQAQTDYLSAVMKVLEARTALEKLLGII